MTRLLTPRLLKAILCSMPAVFNATAGLSEPNDATFTARVDGSVQRYVEMLPSGFEPTREYHALVVLHGHGADRWQYVREPRDECRGARDMAGRYGMIFISPDYRATTSWMGPKAEADVAQIIADLRMKYRLKKVFLAGGSMGGSSALTFAAIHPDLIAGVVSQNGTANHLEYQNFQDAIRASFGGAKDEIPMEYKKRSAEYWPEAFIMPVAITAGGKDASVPPQSVLRLAGILKEMNRKILLIHREEGGHSTDYNDTIAAFEFVVRNALGSVPDA